MEEKLLMLNPIIIDGQSFRKGTFSFQCDGASLIKEKGEL